VLAENKNVCFTLFKTFTSESDSGRRGWWSIILDGELMQVTDPVEISSIGDLLEKEGLFPPGLKEKFWAPC